MVTWLSFTCVKPPQSSARAAVRISIELRKINFRCKGIIRDSSRDGGSFEKRVVSARLLGCQRPPCKRYIQFPAEQAMHQDELAYRPRHGLDRPLCNQGIIVQERHMRRVRRLCSAGREPSPAERDAESM